MKVIRAIENNIYDWRLLGKKLGIKSIILDQIDMELSGHEEHYKLRETVREWQKRVPGYEFCWEKLIQALKMMNKIRLARMISDQYL